jgi:hypothetical protein
MTRCRSLRGVGLVMVIGLGVLAAAARAQQPDNRANPAKHSTGSQCAGEMCPAEEERDEAFELWKQKTQLEMEILQARIDAKKAEIKRREAEHRLTQITPDVTILEKLEKRITAPFAKPTTFEDILKFIKSETASPGDNGIPIYVDPVGLQEAEKTLSSPVMIAMKNVPLKVVLRLVLKQLGLAYKVKDGLLTIDAEH